MKGVELNKLNRHLYALNLFLQTMPPMVQKIPRKKMHLNYKQYKHSLRENGDMSLQSIKVGENAQ